MAAEVPLAIPTIRLFEFTKEHFDNPDIFDRSELPETKKKFDKDREGHIICPISHKKLKIGSICAVVSCCKKVFSAKQLQTAMRTSKLVASHTLCPMCMVPEKPLNPNEVLPYDGKVKATVSEILQIIADKKAFQQNLQTQLDVLKSSIEGREMFKDGFSIDPADPLGNETASLKALVEKAKPTLTSADLSQVNALQTLIDSLTFEIQNLETILKQFKPLENDIKEKQNTSARNALLFKALKISIAAITIIGSLFIFVQRKNSCFWNFR